MLEACRRRQEDGEKKGWNTGGMERQGGRQARQTKGHTNTHRDYPLCNPSSGGAEREEGDGTGWKGVLRIFHTRGSLAPKMFVCVCVLFFLMFVCLRLARLDALSDCLFRNLLIRASVLLRDRWADRTREQHRLGFCAPPCVFVCVSTPRVCVCLCLVVSKNKLLLGGDGQLSGSRRDCL